MEMGHPQTRIAYEQAYLADLSRALTKVEVDCRRECMSVLNFPRSSRVFTKSSRDGYLARTRDIAADA